MSGGGGSTTTSNEPPSWVKPYLEYGGSQAKNLYQGGGPQYYPYSPVTPFSNQQGRAFNMIENRATGGSPVNTAASQNITDTLSGNYLTPGSNPYSKGIWDSMSNDITDRVNSQFEMSGRYGSGAHTGELTRNLSNAGSNFFGNIYNTERGNQMSAIGMAPTIANQDYFDASQLGGVGEQVQNLGQQYNQASRGQFDYNQNLPYDMLSKYMGWVNPYASSGSTSNTSSQQSGLQTAGQVAGIVGTGFAIF